MVGAFEQSGRSGKYDDRWNQLKLLKTRDCTTCDSFWAGSEKIGLLGHEEPLKGASLTCKGAQTFRITR